MKKIKRSVKIIIAIVLVIMLLLASGVIFLPFKAEFN